MHDATPALPSLATASEERTAWGLALALLVALTLVKPLGAIPYLGSLAFTAVAFMQLYAPLWRVDTRGLPSRAIGLHFETWRHDVRLVLGVALVILPPYALLHHLYLTQGHDWLIRLGLETWAPSVPRAVFAPHLPSDASGWGRAIGWLAQCVATHVLGVALPEETFYRGYLQPCLEHRWPPTWRAFGVPMGRAAVVAAALFALGHFLGEWNPMRLGPFFPALLFAWLRNASGSVMGAIGLHALCNVTSELLVVMYAAA